MYDTQYTINNIEEWTQQLANKHPVAQYRVYALARTDQLRKEREEAVIKACGITNLIGARFVHFIGTGYNMAVVEYTNKRGEFFYIPYVKDKQSNEWFPSFELALLAALSLQQSGNTEAVQFAARVLDLPRANPRHAEDCK